MRSLRRAVMALQVGLAAVCAAANLPAAVEAGPLVAPPRPALVGTDERHVHSAQYPDNNQARDALRQFRKDFRDAYGNPKNPPGRDPGYAPPRQVAPSCRSGYYPCALNQGGKIDPGNPGCCWDPSSAGRSQKPKTCPPGYHVDEDGGCAKTVVKSTPPPKPPPAKKTCPPGFYLDADEDCVKIAEPPKPCPPPTKKNARGECVHEYVAPPTPPAPAPVVAASCPPGHPINAAGKGVSLRCSAAPGQGPESEQAGADTSKIKLVRGQHGITYGQRPRSLYKISDLPVSVGRRVIAGKELYADAYVDIGSHTSSCAGTVGNGGELLLIDVPMVNGGLAPACVLYCGKAPPPPTASTPPPQTQTVASNDRPPPAPASSVKTTPSEPTEIATTYVQPYTTAVATVISPTYEEPKQIAVPTVVAATHEEPQRPAVPTAISPTYVEPQRPAAPTVVASTHEEPARKAMPTVISSPFEEPKRQALPTVVAFTQEEPLRKAVPTVVSHAYEEPKRMAVPTAIATPVAVPEAAGAQKDATR